MSWGPRIVAAVQVVTQKTTPAAADFVPNGEPAESHKPAADHLTAAHDNWWALVDKIDEAPATTLAGACGNPDFFSH